MESETNPNIALKPPPLNSDQLNYLIWRYLQEAGYGAAAVNLQRDWKVEPENLPFAKHIKGQALVSLVQKGLRYHHLSLTIDEGGQPLKQPNPSNFFFGPESGRAASPSTSKEPLYRQNERVSSPSLNSLGANKKRDNDSVGPSDSTSAKRPRKPTQGNAGDRNGNGVRKTSASASDAPTAMDIDHVNGNVSLQTIRSPSIGDNQHDENTINGVHMSSRMDVDMEVMTPGMTGLEAMQHDGNEILPPLVHTVTNGKSVGIQVAPAKVANLGPSTTVLSLPESSHVTKTVWRPGDGSLLTVAGDRFCGVWKNSHPGAEEEASKMVYQDFGFSDPSLITAVAWEPEGKLLAIATYSDQAGQLYLFDGRDFTLIESPSASQRAITSLKWLPSAFRLVGIAPYEDTSLGQQPSSSTLLLWDFSERQFSATPLTLTVPELLLDIESPRFTNYGMICAAGGNAVYSCRANKELLVEEKWSSSIADGTSWAFIRCSWLGDSNLTIVAASSDNARIWLPGQNIVKDDAHDAPITGLELRPRVFRSNDPTLIPDFATASMDGTIKVWHFDAQNSSIEMVKRLSIDQQLPIMSISYSPDGFCLAGASFGNAHIWNAEHSYNLMASWEGTSEDWRGTNLKDEDTMSAGGLSSINGESGTSSVDHSLAWDADSKKLAFGLASQVAIINFQR